jgi:hypothetical protein
MTKVHNEGVSACISKWWMRIAMRVANEIRAGTHSSSGLTHHSQFDITANCHAIQRHYSQLPCNPNCPRKELAEGELGVLDDKSTNQVGEEEAGSEEAAMTGAAGHHEEEVEETAENDCAGVITAVESTAIVEPIAQQLDQHKVASSQDRTKIFMHPNDKLGLVVEVVQKMPLRARHYVHGASTTSAECCHRSSTSDTPKDVKIGEARWKGMAAKTVIRLTVGVGEGQHWFVSKWVPRPHME